jgi:hypothetical protein
MGRGKAVKIAFLALDRPDQLDFFGLARFQSLMAGNLTYPLDFHVRLLAKCEKFQRDFCPPSKSWRGRCVPALTDINIGSRSDSAIGPAFKPTHDHGTLHFRHGVKGCNVFSNCHLAIPL